MSEHVPNDDGRLWLRDLDPTLTLIDRPDALSEIKQDKVHIGEIGKSIVNVLKARQNFVAEDRRVEPRRSAEHELARKTGEARMTEVEALATLSALRSIDDLDDVCGKLGWSAGGLDQLDKDNSLKFLSISDMVAVIHEDANGKTYVYSPAETGMRDPDDHTVILEMQLAIQAQDGGIETDRTLFTEEVRLLSELLSTVGMAIESALLEAIEDSSND